MHMETLSLQARVKSPGSNNFTFCFHIRCFSSIFFENISASFSIAVGVACCCVCCTSGSLLNIGGVTCVPHGLPCDVCDCNIWVLHKGSVLICRASGWHFSSFGSRKESERIRNTYKFWMWSFNFPRYLVINTYIGKLPLALVAADGVFLCDEIGHPKIASQT